MTETDVPSDELEIRPEVPLAAVAYGDIVYWGTIAGSVLALIGTLIAFLTDHNLMPVGDVFAGIWSGQSGEAIWQQLTGSAPRGHWYLGALGTGAGLSMAGLVLGVVAVIPAMVVSALLLQGQQRWLYAGLALLGALILTVAALGLLSVPG